MYSIKGSEPAAPVFEPLFELFRHELSAVRWDRLPPESVGEVVENNVIKTCLSVLHFAYRVQAVRQKSAGEGDYSCSPNPLTFEEMVRLLEYVRRHGTVEMTESVVNALREIIPATTCGPLSRSVRCGIGRIVGIMTGILQRCATQVTPPSSSAPSSSSSAFTSETSQELDGHVEMTQTPLTSLEEDRPEKNIYRGSFFKAVREILEEQAEDFSVGDFDEDISEEEYNWIVASTSHDTDEAACEIVKMICEELKSGTGCTPRSESEAQKSSWKKVEDKIKVFFFDKFAKKCILSIIVKLRRDFDCPPLNEEMTPLKPFIMALGCLVEDLMPAGNQEKGQDINWFYKSTARSIASGQRKKVVKQLGDVIFHHLKPGKDSKPHVLVEIKTEIDAVMRLMCQWLNYQAQQCENGMDLASVSLREIRSHLPSPAEAPLPKAPLPEISLPKDPHPKTRFRKKVFTIRLKKKVTPTTDESVISDIAGKATENPFQASKNEELCDTVASSLVRHIMEDWSTEPSILSAIMKLKEMLMAEIADSEAVVKPEQGQIKKIVKALHKDLIRRTGNPDMVEIKLMMQDESFYRWIAKSLKVKLVPQRRSITNIFGSAVRSVVRVLTICCTGHYPNDWDV